MFSDLVESTALSAQLDPEDLREVVRAYQQASSEVIARYDGHIAQYLGDGLLVYFGYPQAHEDDAQRAVRAGLGIVEAIGTLNTTLRRERGIELAVRVGVHTGLVVIGEMGGGGREERLALGDTPNIAARLQGLAEPDAVLMSGSTAPLVAGYFTSKDLGRHPLKGITEPLSVHRVVAERSVQSRLEAASPRGWTPLVGREAEVATLLARWAQVQEGMGQVVLLSGEAGIGKTRLVKVLVAHLAGEPHTRLECRSSPYHQNTPLYPVIDLLERIARFARGDSAEGKLGKLERLLGQYEMPLDEAAPLFAALLSIATPEGHYPPLDLSPQRQKQKTLEALLALLVEQATRAPLLLIVEDLHWIDPSSLEFLELLVGQTPSASICLLLTARPAFPSPWGNRSYLTQVTLNRLSGSEVEEMVERVAGGKALPREVTERLVPQTDGVPLFVEELTKTVLESGWLREVDDRYELTGPLPALAVPATLHDSLMARLDRFAGAKAVAQLGATIGREFSHELLQAVSVWEEEELRQGLQQLVEAELIYPRGVAPRATYRFKHALIQEAARESLLKRTRQNHHRSISEALKERFADTVETQPELLAHHLTEAGSSAEAVGYWQQAGERAHRRSANQEAMAHCRKGLEVLQNLPSGPERDRQELALLQILRWPLSVLQGWAAPELEELNARVQALCEAVEDRQQVFQALRGLALFSLLRGELPKARRLMEEFLALAEESQDPTEIVNAHLDLGHTLYFLGEFPSARKEFETVVARYDFERDRPQVNPHTTVDPGATGQAFLALTLWVLGYPNQARRQGDEALALAREVGHAFSLAHALLEVGQLSHRCGAHGEATEQFEAALAHATEHGFPYFEAWGTFFVGLIRVEQERREEGLAPLHDALATLQARGEGMTRPGFLGLLAGAYGIVGKPERGLCVVNEALTRVEQIGGHLFEAELHRVKGELLLGLTDPDEHRAERCFQDALAVARRQQAKSFELRAAVSLSRLWQRQGKKEQAHRLLAAVFGWITEGFDTADLKEAKALLAELSA
jgi:class 3 adenylate cyclase/predicted ATPase